MGAVTGNNPILDSYINGISAIDEIEGGTKILNTNGEKTNYIELGETVHPGIKLIDDTARVYGKEIKQIRIKGHELEKALSEKNHDNRIIALRVASLFLLVAVPLASVFSTIYFIKAPITLGNTFGIVGSIYLFALSIIGLSTCTAFAFMEKMTKDLKRELNEQKQIFKNRLYENIKLDVNFKGFVSDEDRSKTCNLINVLKSISRENIFFDRAYIGNNDIRTRICDGNKLEHNIDTKTREEVNTAYCDLFDAMAKELEKTYT